MNMPSFSSRVRRSAGLAAFTLIELLVVISIIAVLAGLLLPVTNSVMRTARKTSARNTEMNIVAAVNNYYAEYGQYPYVNTDTSSSSTPKDFTYMVKNGTNNGQLFDVLRALNTVGNGASTDLAALNSRRISYFESKNVKSKTSPKDGFIVTDGATSPNQVKLKNGDLVDPWGNLYGIRMDTSYSNAIDNPYDQENETATDTSGDSTKTDQTVLRTGVVAFSYGEDGLRGKKGETVNQPYSPTPGDDVDSWQ